MKKARKVKTWTKEFNSFQCYEIVKGFQQYCDIPSHTLGESNQQKYAQPLVNESHVNLDANEVIADPTPNHSVRPQGRKATKEAIRKGKKVAKDGNPMTSAVETIAANQTSMMSKIEKRDAEYARLLHEQEQRDTIRLQMEMRNEAFKIQEREERIVGMDTNNMSPNKKAYWKRKQKVIAEREESYATSASIPHPPFTGGYYPQSLATTFHRSLLSTISTTTFYRWCPFTFLYK